jgi:hypothetical protein
MLDIETFSTQPNALVVSVGVVNLWNDESFFARLDLTGQQNRHIDPNTVLWWMQQSEEAQAHLHEKPHISLTEQLYEFVDFLGYKPIMWAKPVSFDCVIMETLLTENNIKIPWFHRDKRCVHSIRSQHDNWQKDDVPMTAHHPVEDCRSQIREILKNGVKIQ